MIRRVRVIGYKSLADVEIELKPLTVILGPNAAGKSNLFDALSLLSRMATRPTLREAFEGHRGLPLEAFHFNAGGLDELQKRNSARFTIEIDAKLPVSVLDSTENRTRELLKIRSEGHEELGIKDLEWQKAHHLEEHFLRYALTVEVRPDTGFLSVADEQLVALTEDGMVKQSRAPFIEKTKNKLYLRDKADGREHDLGLDYTLLSRPSYIYSVLYPHIGAFKEALLGWHFYYFEPEAMRRAVPPGEVHSLRPNGGDLAAFFKTIQANERQFDDLNRSLSLLLPGVDRLEFGPLHEGLLQLKVIDGGVPFSLRQVSEGTLRVLALLAITNPLAQSAVVGFEEPENGVHPRRLRLIARLLQNAADRGMQVLVNTHSPLLPEYFDDESLIICRRRDHRTEFVPFRSVSPQTRPQEIEAALEEETPLFERIIRGDFDA